MESKLDERGNDMESPSHREREGERDEGERVVCRWQECLHLRNSTIWKMLSIDSMKTKRRKRNWKRWKYLTKFISAHLIKSIEVDENKWKSALIVATLEREIGFDIWTIVLRFFVDTFHTINIKRNYPRSTPCDQPWFTSKTFVNCSIDIKRQARSIDDRPMLSDLF